VRQLIAWTYALLSRVTLPAGRPPMFFEYLRQKTRQAVIDGINDALQEFHETPGLSPRPAPVKTEPDEEERSAPNLIVGETASLENTKTITGETHEQGGQEQQPRKRGRPRKELQCPAPLSQTNKP
jgi:hypothetical protein